MTRIIPVVGGQFGSEAKGHVTWQILQRLTDKDNIQPEDIMCVRVAGPNAGHTALGMDGMYHAFRQLPMSVLLPGVHSAIAAGSEIDMPVLVAEIKEAIDQGFNPKRLIVDPEATLLFERDHATERHVELTDRIGSTGKGIGAARVARLMREPGRRLMDDPDCIKILQNLGVSVVHVTEAYPGHESIVIEGTQGFGLGLHAGYYPTCTSSDCRAIDFMAMAGVTPRYGDDIMPIVVLRPYPIRVAGNSGPLLNETSWEALGLEPEFTTVTKKMRRVGHWDAELALRAVYANGGPKTAKVAITMLDQVEPQIKFARETHQIMDAARTYDFIKMVTRDTAGARILLATTGPATAVWL